MLAHAATVSDFVAAPNRYLYRQGYLAFNVGWMFGALLWGRLGAELFPSIAELLDEQLAQVPPHVSLLDLTRVEWLDLRAFETMSEYVRTRNELMARKIRKQAVLRPRGANAVLVSGFVHIGGLSYPAAIMESPEDAARYLEDPRVPAVLAEAARAAERSAATPTRTALQAYLASHLRDKDLGGAARALKTSARTLQRRLRDEGSSFQAELNAERVAAAQAMLLSTDDKLSAIALEVGCSSLQHLSLIFRKVTGEAPGAWRASRRR